MKEEVGVGHLELPMRREISSKLHELNIAIAQLGDVSVDNEVSEVTSSILRSVSSVFRRCS